jgi:hypothetical protein
VIIPATINHSQEQLSPRQFIQLTEVRSFRAQEKQDIRFPKFLNNLFRLTTLMWDLMAPSHVMKP